MRLNTLRSGCEYPLELPCDGRRCESGRVGCCGSEQKEARPIKQTQTGQQCCSRRGAQEIHIHLYFDYFFNRECYPVVTEQ